MIKMCLKVLMLLFVAVTTDCHLLKKLLGPHQPMSQGFGFSFNFGGIPHSNPGPLAPHFEQEYEQSEYDYEQHEDHHYYQQHSPVNAGYESNGNPNQNNEIQNPNYLPKPQHTVVDNSQKPQNNPAYRPNPSPPKATYGNANAKENEQPYQINKPNHPMPNRPSAYDITDEEPSEISNPFVNDQVKPNNIRPQVPPVTFKPQITTTSTTTAPEDDDVPQFVALNRYKGKNSAAKRHASSRHEERFEIDPRIRDY